MKHRMTNWNAVLVLIVILLLPTVVLADPPDPNDIPIDGGLSLLLAAGAAYGAKKYRDYKKHGKEEKL